MKNKPLLNESTVRKFMKLANLGRVGEGFIAENYNQEEETLEEESELAEDKHFGGTKGHEMKPLKAGKKSSAKVMKEEESLEEQEEMGMEEPAGDMPEVPEVEPAEEPAGEMDATDLADKIIQVLQDAGLVDVVEDEGEDDDGDEGDMPEPEVEEPEVVDDETMEDSSTEMMEAKKAKLAKVVAERVMTRIQKESRIDRLAETITQRVMAEAKRRG